MHQDTRIGLALGILLIGVVGALFFRNERTASDDVPAMSDPDSLDAQIAERPIAPYTKPKSDGKTAKADKSWEVPAWMGDRAKPPAGVGPPEPIPVTSTRDATPPQQDILEPVPTPPGVEIAEPTPPVETNQDKGDLVEYEVQSGDTLSDIAHRVFGDSNRYRELFELNRDRLRTPHDLRIGRRILVPRYQ